MRRKSQSQISICQPNKCFVNVINKNIWSPLPLIIPCRKVLSDSPAVNPTRPLLPLPSPPWRTLPSTLTFEFVLLTDQKAFGCLLCGSSHTVAAQPGWSHYSESPTRKHKTPYFPSKTVHWRSGYGHCKLLCRYVQAKKRNNNPSTNS